MKQAIISPRVSEKTYALAANGNVYVFNVPADANKIEVKKLVEELYKVTVLDVNMLNIKGKAKKSVKKSGKQTKGRRSDYKKAYVTVKKGQTIPVFATEEKEEKPKKGAK